MRILVTSFTYAPRKNGVQFVTQYLCEGLAARGHQVTVITQQYPGLPQHEVVNRVSVERWPVGTRHLHHYGPRKQYVRWILENQDFFDVMINVGTQTALTDWLLPYMDKIHLPKILHVHSIWDFEIHPWDRNSFSSLVKKLGANLRWRIYYAVHGHAFRAYDRVLQLYPQDYSVVDFQRWYGIKSDILENAAEDAFHLEAPVPFERRRRAIVCVANFNQLKNQIDLVKAFLLSDLSGWELDLIGSSRTPELDRIRSMENTMRREMGASCCDKPIHYFVGLGRPETINFVKTASIFALSSLREAFPVSLIEAMSAGIPWVSTDVGIVRYLPGGVVVSDAKDIGSALSGLANDIHKQASLGQEGYQYAARNFRIQDKVAELEQILREVTKE